MLFQHYRNYNVICIFFKDSVFRELHLKNSVKHKELPIESQFWICQYAGIQLTT
jgi:hypothetical protein